MNDTQKLKSTSGEWYWEDDISTACTLRVLSDYNVEVCSLQSEDDANLIVQSKNLYYALESTSKELEWAINKINDYINANHNYSGLDAPELIDMETLHINQVLLAKVRGDL